MYFDDYSTSFQSLYSPMYNVQANYGAMNGGGYGAGMGMGMPGMGMYSGSMTNIGVGQFGADQLVKGDERANNYYARPIATHKKKDELPTILGIVGAALGTAAVLLALKKGKFKKAPKIPTPPTPPVVPPTPPVVPPVVPPTPPVVPPVVPPTPPVVPPVVPPTPPVVPPVVPNVSNFGSQPYVAPKYLNRNAQGYNIAQNMTSKNGILNGLNNVKTTNNVLVTAPDGRMVPIPKVTAAAKNPLVESIINPSKGRLVKGVEPLSYEAAVHQQVAEDLANLGNKQNPLVNSIINPSKGRLVKEIAPKSLSEISSAELATTQGRMTPEAQAAYNRTLGQQFKPGVAKDAARKDAAMAFTSKDFNPYVSDASNNLFTARPDMSRAGNVVYTTHTPESLANGYSIGSNAKGADKLAELLAKLQA